MQAGTLASVSKALRRAWIAACGLAAVCALIYLGWRSAEQSSRPIPWEYSLRVEPYPFDGQPQFEFAASERETRAALAEAREHAEETGELIAAIWRGFRLTPPQEAAALPSDKRWHITALAVRFSLPGRLVLDLASNRAPLDPLAEAACHLDGNELRFALAIRLPDSSNPEDHGALRMVAFERESLRVLIDEELDAESALPARSPDDWVPGWRDFGGLDRLWSPSYGEWAHWMPISWNGPGSGELASWNHPSFDAMIKAALSPNQRRLSPLELDEWPEPVWFLRLRFQPD